ncbi:EAL domain-containing protein [Bacillus sp. HMF5848]|uniref:EAL domain-containing protein n=1 Tax=Bacillus sp. HMF5848 TaxID=2495421 RepID=UPI000F78600E|nr:EAL domain-containing protein [Bacillus sp. HMF5848]RSK28223.1 EAL domain-containing protein [Bacillus sp. HMF5848]
MSDNCPNCSIIYKIYDVGYVFIATETEAIQQKLLSMPTLKESQLINYENEQIITISYESKKMLKSLLEPLQDLENSDKDNIAIAVNNVSNASYLHFIGYPYFHNHIHYEKVLEYIYHGELKVALQPIIDLETNKLLGYENLLRTTMPSEIGPKELFETASITGTHSYLDKRAREEAIKARSNLIPPGVKSFINFLPSTIYNPDFCLQHTFSIVRKYNVSPEDLIFEVVETEKVEDVKHLKRILNTYKASGMKVALDDVGSGYATLEMLRELQPDYVKIDRKYISHCEADITKQQFLKKVVEIAEQLNIFVLAEGIERAEELQYCKNIGMHYAQGYYIGRPTTQKKLISHP